MKRNRFFGLGVAALALILAAFAPAKAEAQSVKGTYWMSEVTAASGGDQITTINALGLRMYTVTQFTDKKAEVGIVFCGMPGYDREVVNLWSQRANQGKTSGEIRISGTADFTQRGNTITLANNEGTFTLSNNGLNLTMGSNVFSKINLVAGKWPNITDHPELMATK